MKCEDVREWRCDLIQCMCYAALSPLAAFRVSPQASTNNSVYAPSVVEVG